MNLKKFIKQNNSGMSIVETMIGISIITVVMFFYASAYLNVKKSKKWSETIMLKNELADDLISDLSLYTQCNRILRAATGSDALSASFDNNISIAPFAEKFDHPSLEIDTVKLKYNLVVDADPNSGSTYKKYMGQLSFAFKPRAGSSQKMQVRDVTTDIVIFDEHGTGLLSDATCSTPNAEVLASVGEICALYGGTVIDGTHCDFSRYFRKHYSGLTEPAVPIVDVNSDVAKRHTLSDVLCYVDTLIALVPDQNVTTTGPRNYDLDYYRKNYTTRFCKRPGVVKASSSVNMNEATDAISENVKPALFDVDSFPKNRCNFYSYDYQTFTYSCVNSCTHVSGYIYNGKPYCYDSYYQSSWYYMYCYYYGYGGC